MDIFPNLIEISNTAKLVHGLVWLVVCVVTFFVLRHRFSHWSLRIRLVTLFLVAFSLGCGLLLSLHLVDWEAVLSSRGQISRGHYCPEGCSCGRILVKDGENRLIKAEELLSPTNRQPYTVKYAYDHRGRMVWKQISTNAVVVSTRTLNWDDYNIIAETLAQDTATNLTYNIWGLDLDGTLQGAGGVGGLLAVVKDSATYAPDWDANGNVMEYLSADGPIVAHYEYSPFGEIIVQSGDLADSFTHRFSTKPWCGVTGLSEYEMRKYSPLLGRWLSRDPIEEESFIRRLKQGQSLQEKPKLRSRSKQPVYLFARNCQTCTYDILGLDDPGCNLPDIINPGRGNRGGADCYRRCCAQHDACYFRNGCTQTSWGLNIGGIAADIAGCKFCSIFIKVISPCARCNSSVVACFARCCTGVNPPNGEQWFCPNGEHKGEWFDDWKKIPADCWENGHKPENP